MSPRDARQSGAPTHRNRGALRARAGCGDTSRSSWAMASRPRNSGRCRRTGTSRFIESRRVIGQLRSAACEATQSATLSLTFWERRSGFAFAALPRIAGHGRRTHAIAPFGTVGWTGARQGSSAHELRACEPSSRSAQRAHRSNLGAPHPHVRSDVALQLALRFVRLVENRRSHRSAER